MSKKLISYLSIGISCAAGTFVISNLFIIAYTQVFTAPSSFILAVCFFVASVIMILPSFYLNRKTTFGDKGRKSNKFKTLLKAYSIYIISPLIASIITYFLQNIFNFEARDINISVLTLNNYDFNYGRYFLQLTAIGISTIGNYLGQKIWIYH